MMTRSEADRRSHERFETEALIDYSRFTSYTSDCHQAVVKNCSHGGLCFESGNELLPGQYLRIRLKQEHPTLDPRAEALERIRTNAIVRVRWCTQHDPSRGSTYRVGVGYCYPPLPSAGHYTANS